jgi:hypothetical protein
MRIFKAEAVAGDIKEHIGWTDQRKYVQQANKGKPGESWVCKLRVPYPGVLARVAALLTV